ncbi:ATP-binding protein [uncultured Modestobacter sp.]|uniref:ATP-binding protein n=1 Tax=uncultured Modestobacter sp. TaxID=380048 RepID=UPI00260A167B|nr:ATP-binding protein [uncultured Modestobacter sp.]
MKHQSWTAGQYGQVAASWHEDTPAPPAADSRLTLELATLALLSRVRRQVRSFLQDSLDSDGGAGCGPDEAQDAVESAILVIDELASNAVRHGLAPASLHVCDEPGRWVVMVTDSAPHRRPTPARDRPAEAGGMGLYVVADLTAEHGVHYAPAHKIVWVCIDKPR